MRASHDHEIKYLDTAAAYLALKRQAEHEDRSVGSLLRHIVHDYLHTAACAEQRAESSHESGRGQESP